MLKAGRISDSGFNIFSLAKINHCYNFIYLLINVQILIELTCLENESCSEHKNNLVSNDIKVVSLLR